MAIAVTRPPSGTTLRKKTEAELRQMLEVTREDFRRADQMLANAGSIQERWQGEVLFRNTVRASAAVRSELARRSRLSPQRVGGLHG